MAKLASRRGEIIPARGIIEQIQRKFSNGATNLENVNRLTAKPELNWNQLIFLENAHLL